MKRNALVDINISIYVFTSKTVDKTYITRFEKIIANGKRSIKECCKLAAYDFNLTDRLTDTGSFTISDHKVTIYAADKNFSTYVNQAFQKILKRGKKNHKKIPTTCMSIYADEAVDKYYPADFVDLMASRKNIREEIDLLAPYKFHLSTDVECFAIQGHKVAINSADDCFTSYANLALNHIVKDEEAKRSNDVQLYLPTLKRLWLCIITQPKDTE